MTGAVRALNADRALIPFFHSPLAREICKTILRFPRGSHPKEAAWIDSNVALQNPTDAQ